MSKFVIECPKCGRYAEASTGFFAKKTIDCVCGYTINVKTDKVSSKVCPYCGNTVIYDQSKGDGAVCPVCHNKINTVENKAIVVNFTCPSCSCKLSVDKKISQYTCPLCDTVIDVRKRMEKERVKNQGIISVIKYEGDNNTFVWKHPIEDYNLGTQLIVHESQEAVFFRDGKALDLFGAGRYTLATQNIPLLENLYKLPSDGVEFFHSEVYFVNMTTQMGIKWGTDSKVRLFDPSSGIHIEIGACGNFSLRVCNSRKLLVKLIGTTSVFHNNEVMGSNQFDIETVVGKFRALVMNKVKSNLAKVIKDNNVNILEVDEYIDIISEKLRVAINEMLEEYGLTMPEFFVTSIATPDEDPNFIRLKQQFADRTLKVREEEILQAEAEAAQSRKMVEAETDAKLKIISAKAEAESYKAMAFAEAEEMKAKGYTYQQESSRMVGMEAMKNGISGGESGVGSGLGDIAGLGVALGAMGGVINMTKEVIDPVMQTSSNIGGTVVNSVNEGWNCNCGCKNIKSNFCPDCGSKREDVELGIWDCSCGCKNIKSNFCPNCGSKKIEVDTWDCSCGCKNIKSNFCPNCGNKKVKLDTWDCSCGCKNIKSNFCPDCGNKKEVRNE